MQSHSPVGGGVDAGSGVAVPAGGATIAEQIACVERELGMRHRVYKRWVVQGKLTQSAADIEISRMEAVRDTLKRAQIKLTDRESGQLFSGEVYGPAKVRQDERARVLGALAPMVHSDVMVRLQQKLDRG